MSESPERRAGVADVIVHGRDTQAGAEVLFAAVSPRTATVSGRYFRNQGLGTLSEAARERGAARRLWTESAALLGIDEPLAEPDDRAVAAGDRTAPADS